MFSWQNSVDITAKFAESTNPMFTFPKGHAAHVCKKCAALPAAQRSENIILTKLWNLPWQFSGQQREWLRRLRNDSYLDVASTARELYADRFPYAARDERKQQLHIDRMEFIVCGEVYDEYGDGWHRELYSPLTGRRTR